MKKKTLFLLMVLFACGIGQIMADEVKMAYTGSSTTNMTGNNDAATVGLDDSSWSVVGDKGGNGNYPGLNKAGQIRLYGAETNHNFVTVTATAGQTISSVTVTYGPSNYNAKVTVNGSEIIGTGTNNTEKTYEINGSSFSIVHNYSTTTQVYIISAKITYSSPGKLQSIAVSGTPTKTEYFVGDSFDPAGLTVKGTYTESGEKNITTGITWSCVPETFDNLADATSVKVTAKVGDIKSEEYTVYNIKVIEKPYFFYESFDKCDGTGGDESWSGTIASSAIAPTNFDNIGWTYEFVYKAKKCAKLGKGSEGKGSAETPEIDCGDAKAVCLTFKAAAWDGKTENTKLNISATNGTIRTEPVTMIKGEWTEYKLYVYDITGSLKIKFEGESASNSRFFLDEVMVSKPTAPISDAKYATLCLPFKYTVPEGVTAYTGEATNDGVTLSAIDGVVPANTGVIIYSETPGTYTFTGSAETPASIVKNDLVGVTETTTIPEGSYILALDTDDTAKFFEIDPKDNELAAYKAYLAIPEGVTPSKALAIRRGDGTGIRTIEAQAANQYFDLMGRKVQNPERGIYILNGKKVYVK